VCCVFNIVCLANSGILLDSFNIRVFIFDGSGLMSTNVLRQDAAAKCTEFERYCTMLVKAVDELDPMIFFGWFWCILCIMSG